ncbi:hypothetical protein HD806DRAFT_541680 [Xylariaceae sp. AK1471]|nr:hypothetical protein HD806DRAFT_541680 [Xylariaceae sp. AK1471]
MSSSGHATQKSHHSTDASPKSSASVAPEPLLDNRLHAWMQENGGYVGGQHIRSDLIMSRKLVDWDERWAAATSRTGGSRRRHFLPAWSKDDGGSSSSLGALHSSSSQDIDLINRLRHSDSLEHAFHENFHALIRCYQRWLTRWASTASSDQEAGDNRKTTRAASSNGAQSHQREQRKDKRKYKGEDGLRGGGGGGGGLGGGDGGPPPFKKSQKLRLACPFFKRNAVKYADHQYCLHHWPNTSRLKDHLYQQHMLSGIQCGLCGVEFSSQSSFQAHQREPGACEQRDFEPLEGVDALTKMKLQDKTLARGGTEESKWFAIYAILFPNDDPSSYPDPYYDLSPVLRQQVAIFVEAELPSIIQNAINQVANNVDTRTNLDFNELHTIITTSISGSLHRFRPEQAFPPRNIPDAEAKVGDSSFCPALSVQSAQTLSHSQELVLMEDPVEAAGRNAAEDLLRQFEEGLEHEQAFTNTLAADLNQFVDYLGQLESSEPPANTPNECVF